MKLLGSPPSETNAYDGEHLPESSSSIKELGSPRSSSIRAHQAQPSPRQAKGHGASTVDASAPMTTLPSLSRPQEAFRLPPLSTLHDCAESADDQRVRRQRPRYDDDDEYDRAPRGEYAYSPPSSSRRRFDEEAHPSGAGEYEHELPHPRQDIRSAYPVRADYAYKREDGLSRAASDNHDGYTYATSTYDEPDDRHANFAARKAHLISGPDARTNEQLAHLRSSYDDDAANYDRDVSRGGSIEQGSYGETRSHERMPSSSSHQRHSPLRRQRQQTDQGQCPSSYPRPSPPLPLPPLSAPPLRAIDTSRATLRGSPPSSSAAGLGGAADAFARNAVRAPFKDSPTSASVPSSASRISPPPFARESSYAAHPASSSLAQTQSGGGDGGRAAPLKREEEEYGRHTSATGAAGVVVARRSSLSPSRRGPRLPSIRMMSEMPHSPPSLESPSAYQSKEQIDVIGGGGAHDPVPSSNDVATLPPSAIDAQRFQSSQRPSSSFMASLLRAARSPDPNTPSHQSPMSVHSILEGRAPSPNQHLRRTRKRRTSSVQEPLQGSALEAATRAQGFPRLSEPAHHRPHTDDALSSHHHASHSHPHQHTVRGSSVGMSPHSPVEGGYYAHSSSNGSRWRSSEWSPARQDVPASPYAHSAYGHSPSVQQFRFEQPHPSMPPTAYAGNSGVPGSMHSPHAPSFGHSQYGARAPSYSPHASHQRPASTASHHSPYHAQQPFARSDLASMRTTKSVHHPHAHHASHHYGHTAGHASRSSYMGAKPNLGNPSSTSMVESAHWNAELASRARAEQDTWARTSMSERRQQVTQSIWEARQQLCSTLSYWPPPQSNMTTIRCMYANIAQKSYGSEKRFLCPPPVVKINGPLRPCKWVTMRVTLGDSAGPQGVMGAGGAPTGVLGGVVAGGEEPALLDAQGEARFGKLHVGSVSEATSKVFRLQVNLLRAEMTSEDAKNGGAIRAFQDVEGPLQLPSYAWSTFHSSPINVISKPARKSVRTRAASPAIASGSIVCLYNRLNSQTVRTKYLGVESGTVEDVSQTEVARKLVARQDGWEGFAIELLARPLHDPAVARANMRGLPSDEWGITYGSIVCLRDVNSKLCSDPMLICKVDKGRVELSSVIGSGSANLVRFQIASKNREEARQILFGGAREMRKGGANASKTRDAQTSTLSGNAHDAREGSEAGSGASTPPVPSHASMPQAGHQAGQTASANFDANSMLGGPVIQMQKVTLMHVTLRPSSRSADEIECDLSTPRAYLCSTASESLRDEPHQPALARSLARLESRSVAVRQGTYDLPLDEPVAPAEASSSNVGRQTSPSSTFNNNESPTTAQAYVQAQSASVGFSHPPAVVYDSIGSGGQVDVLEDQFCWTIVTISCTEVSYIEANASVNSSNSSSNNSNSLTTNNAGRLQYPHLPLSPLPVTPFPCLAAQPSYDARSHSLAATVHDYLYADGLDPMRQMLNTVSAVHAVPHKAAHEIWLAHSGPLAAHASSAGPYMSDVTVNLPSMEHLITLQLELNEQSASSRDSIGRIRLPILFVRVAQGLTFPSGHWLVAERITGSMRDPRDVLAWSFRIV